MKYLLIVFTLLATFTLQPVLAEESADAPTAPSGGDASGDNGGGTADAESGTKKPAAEEAEPECD